MVRKTDDMLERDLWDLGDIQSGRYIEIEQSRERLMEVVSGGLRDYTPSYFPKPRINELSRVIQNLGREYLMLFELRYIGVKIDGVYTPLEIKTVASHLKWSRRKTFSRYKDMKDLIRDKMPIYAKRRHNHLNYAPKLLESVVIS